MLSSYSCCPTPCSSPAPSKIIVRTGGASLCHVQCDRPGAACPPCLPECPASLAPHCSAPHGELPVHAEHAVHADHAEHAVRADHAEHSVPAERASLQSAAYNGSAEALQHDDKAWEVTMGDQKGIHVGNGMVPEGGQNPARPKAAATHFQVDHTFEVKGVGCVVSGKVVSGEVAVGQVLNLGPTGQGLFSEVQVTCIHRSQV